MGSANECSCVLYTKPEATSSLCCRARLFAIAQPLWQAFCFDVLQGRKPVTRGDPKVCCGRQSSMQPFPACYYHPQTADFAGKLSTWCDRVFSSCGVVKIPKARESVLALHSSRFIRLSNCSDAFKEAGLSFGPTSLVPRISCPVFPPVSLRSRQEHLVGHNIRQQRKSHEDKQCFTREGRGQEHSATRIVFVTKPGFRFWSQTIWHDMAIPKREFGSTFI